MAAFEQHVNAAVIFSGIALVPLYSSGLINMNHALALLAYGLLGGILPDLDSDHSKPIQITFRILSIFLPLIILLSINIELSVTKILFAWFISSILLNLFVFRVFVSATNHRGIFHSIPMGILFALTLFIILNHIFYYPSFFSTISGIFLLFGFLVHLILDEIYSINALGMRLKKSFGTALKLYDKNNMIGTLILYIIISIIYYIFPIDNSIFSKIYSSLQHLKL